jgi:hypothetical protein
LLLIQLVLVVIVLFLLLLVLLILLVLVVIGLFIFFLLLFSCWSSRNRASIGTEVVLACLSVLRVWQALCGSDTSCGN